MNFEDVFTLNHVSKIEDYTTYWKSVKPQSDAEFFQRWLFAYTSIHTTWQANVRAYNHIKNFNVWLNDKEKLREQLILSKAGCHNLRTESIWDFSGKFWANPQNYKKDENETWTGMRNRLSLDLKGIGLAKTSFALELCYPESAEVVCLDVHMLRALNLKTNGYRANNQGELTSYMNGEKLWLKKSQFWNSAPYILRCVFWDIIQGQKNSRYWSWCLENQLAFDLVV